MISFLRSSNNIISGISLFLENTQRYSQLKVSNWCHNTGSKLVMVTAVVGLLEIEMERMKLLGVRGKIIKNT